MGGEAHAREEERELGRLVQAGALAARLLDRGAIEPEAEAMIRAAADEAVNHLARANLSFVRARAARWGPASADARDDLEGAGRVGLIIAIKRFDPEMGPLQPYARWWVDREISEHAYHFSTAVTISNRRIAAIRRHLRETSPHDDAPPGASELDKRLLAAVRGQVPMDTDGTVPTLPADRDGDVVASMVVEQLDQAQGRSRFDAIVALLPPREEAVIRARFIEQKLQREIAAELGVHHARVSRIEARARWRLAEYARAAGAEAGQLPERAQLIAAGLIPPERPR